MPDVAVLGVFPITMHLYRRARIHVYALLLIVDWFDVPTRSNEPIYVGASAQRVSRVELCIYIKISHKISTKTVQVHTSSTNTKSLHMLSTNRSLRTAVMSRVRV